MRSSATRALSLVALSAILSGTIACKPKPLPLEAKASLVIRDGKAVIVVDVTTDPGMHVVIDQGEQPGHEKNTLDCKPSGARQTSGADGRLSVDLCWSGREPEQVYSVEAKDPNRNAEGASVELAGRKATAGDGGVLRASFDVFTFAPKVFDEVVEPGATIDAPLVITFANGHRLSAKVHHDAAAVRTAVVTILRESVRGKATGIALPGDDANPEGRRALVLSSWRADGDRAAKLFGHAKTPSDVDFVATGRDLGIVMGTCSVPNGGRRNVGTIEGELMIYARRTGKVVLMERIKPRDATCPAPPGALVFDDRDLWARIDEFLAKAR